jgi:hypothetical protein
MKLSLCNFLHSAVTSSLLDPNILISSLFSYTINYVILWGWKTKFHTHTKNKLHYAYFNLYVFWFCPSKRAGYLGRRSAELSPYAARVAFSDTLYDWVVFIAECHKLCIILWISLKNTPYRKLHRMKLVDPNYVHVLRYGRGPGQLQEQIIQSLVCAQIA